MVIGCSQQRAIPMHSQTVPHEVDIDGHGTGATLTEAFAGAAPPWSATNRRRKPRMCRSAS
ncbi:hypothetical protein D3C84_354470 [compost metagenome]